MNCFSETDATPVSTDMLDNAVGIHEIEVFATQEIGIACIPMDHARARIGSRRSVDEDEPRGLFRRQLPGQFRAAEVDDGHVFQVGESPTQPFPALPTQVLADM